ncbi:MAG: hypothetical protein ICV56_04450 [Nitrososphaeraceae archaeon]|nr:hypothetical protein [Nitrososphaeraceae archaeon]
MLFIISVSLVVFLIDGTWINNSAFAQKNEEEQQQLTNTLGVKITSHSLWQKVPVGELTISGMSADNQTMNCEVYVDVNDQKPFQNATATGPGGANDYSTWTFTYTDKYYPIQKGLNELTAKLSCIDNNNAAKVTKWYSVNIVGVSSYGNEKDQ